MTWGNWGETGDGCTYHRRDSETRADGVSLRMIAESVTAGRKGHKLSSIIRPDQGTGYVDFEEVAMMDKRLKEVKKGWWSRMGTVARSKWKKKTGRIGPARVKKAEDRGRKGNVDCTELTGVHRWEMAKFMGDEWVRRKTTYSSGCSHCKQVSFTIANGCKP